MPLSKVATVTDEKSEFAAREYKTAPTLKIFACGARYRTSDREKAADKHFAGGNAAKIRLYSPVSLISPDFFLTFTRKILAPSIFRTS